MQLIFDVGAHKGEDTDFYLKKGFRVVAVEANAVLAQELRNKYAEAIRNGQLTVVESAVAEKDGEIEFFVNERSVFGTIHQSWAERNEKMGSPSTKVKVQAVSFGTLLKKHGVPYYLKIDIEGADMLCVYALEHAASRPQYLSIESNKTSWRELVAEFDILEKLGYTRFKVVDQASIQAQKEPKPAREGRFADHQFPEGSTGLFGAELPGPWLSKKQALRQYALIFFQYRFFGDNTWGGKAARILPWRIHRFLIPAWYDTHAALG